MTDMTVAQTILAQLGGNKFIAMTGAKNFVGGDRVLNFTLPGGRGFCKEGINRVRIELTDMDDYTVTYMRVRGMKLKTIEKSEGIYCDNLRSNFERVTGLRTSL
jgi:hypothetical protein